MRYRLGLKLPDQVVLDAYIEGLNTIRSKISSGLHQTNSLPIDELEETLMDWLKGKGFEDAWKLAPILVEVGVSVSQLEEFLVPVSPELYSLALHEFFATVSRDVAIASVVQASGRFPSNMFLWGADPVPLDG